ncbi:MAG TPA: hypothetical protein EYQ73_04640 [Candidatus Poseidoniales archaeon]|nr:hypothetical protein [Candidatus Poseidoniales archaeon]HIL64597.1 hypothetical protein [Candidatus Poseidoniales archaeon]
MLWCLGCACTGTGAAYATGAAGAAGAIGIGAEAAGATGATGACTAGIGAGAGGAAGGAGGCMFIYLLGLFSPTTDLLHCLPQFFVGVGSLLGIQQFDEAGIFDQCLDLPRGFERHFISGQIANLADLIQ